STPAAILHIKTNGGNVLFGGAGCNAGYTGFGFGSTLSGCTNYSLLGNGSDTIVNRPAGGSVHFREANSTQMAIAPGGFVGIGTTAPTAPLTVFNATTARFDLLTSSPANPSFGFSQSVRADGSWLLSTSSGAARMVVDNSGLVGIGTTSPNPLARLTVSGGIFTNGTLSLTPVSGGNISLCLLGNQIATCGSSLRYKTDVVGFGDGLDLIKRLRPVTFRWKSNDGKDLGLVAEEVNAVEPLLTTVNNEGKVEGVKYDRVAVVLVNAVNEQQTQIDVQRKQIDEQKQTIQRQQIEIDALVKIVCSQNNSADLCRQRK
ncbi:MAG: tail fiber domain-containing protein, partial [Pyrinomonadaceae bacterium]